MILCEKCKIKQKVQSGIESILEFPFKLYDDKQVLKKDLLDIQENNSDFLTKKYDKYESNIIHELVYKLVKCKYIDKQYRKQHIWALEILSELPEYPNFLLEKNIKNELPIEAFVRLSEDNHTKHYDSILNLLTKNCPIPIIFIKKDNEPHTIENNPDSNKGIYVLEEKKRVINPLIGLLTNQYHNLQERLFKYLELHYSNKVTKCDLCNKTLDLFNNLEDIGLDAKYDKNLTIIVKNVEHIISLRNKAIALSADDNVNRRHKHIIVYFENLLEKLIGNSEIENNLKSEE